MRSKSIISIININEEIVSMKFSPCSDILATKSTPSDPLIATIGNGRKNKIIGRDRFVTPVRVISFSNSGDLCAIGSGQYVYILKNYREIHTIESDGEKEKIYILSGSFSCCENYFIYGDDKGYINFFSLISKNIEKRISVGAARVTLLSFSASSNCIAVHDRNGNFKIGNFMSEPTIIYESDFSLNSKLQSIIGSPEGNYIILQIREAHSFEILDIYKGQVIYKSNPCLRSIGSISGSPSGNFISATHLGFVGIWDFTILAKANPEEKRVNSNSLNTECLSWVSDLRHFHIRGCDFSDAIMEDKDSILIKEFQKQIDLI